MRDITPWSDGIQTQSVPEWLTSRKQPSDFDKINAIHIAGTKGKGSTAAFTSSILCQFIGQPGGRGLEKVGLYTSPHLRFVRERIQLNGEPLSESQFARYFFEVWDRLEKAAEDEGIDPSTPGTKPVYFRYLTLMAFHTYVSEGVDAAVIECGIGGEYDSTNVIESPTVTGITSLGIDHEAMLGSTIGEIAWHKAGIMKKGVKCFTTSTQLPDAKSVLEWVARERESSLVYVDVDPQIANGTIQLGLQAEFQKSNASIAVSLAREWLAQRGFEVDEHKIRRGLQEVRWPGRCDTRLETGLRWCIDGGHTLESIELSGKWFASQLLTTSTSTPIPTSSKPTRHAQPRFLIFNQQTRDAAALAKALFQTLSTALNDRHPFTHAIFCTNTTFKETGFRPDLVSVNTNASDVEALKVQNNLADTWKSMDPAAEVHVVRTIEEAVDLVRGSVKQQQALRGIGGSDQEVHGQQDDVTALVTGSLHLVGGFLEVLASTGE